MACVAYGTAKLEIFAVTPGAPAATSSSVAGHRFHLYAFLHPNCSCSTATVAELQKLLGQEKAPVDVTAIIDTSGLSLGDARPLQTSLASSAQIALEIDPDGTKTAGFGAKTSGEILLYGPTGKLEFSGGITAARGHEGDNAGESAIVNILNGRKPETRHTPTYGCSLSPASVKR